MKTIRLSLICFFAIFIGGVSYGQSTVHWMKDGVWYPVSKVKGDRPYCFVGDGMERGREEQVTMLAAPSFGPGYLNVEILENKRQGIARTDGMLKFVAERGMFTFTARVTSQIDMENVYYVFRFKEVSNAVFKCRSLGSLKAGKPREISIMTTLSYEMPEQIHFYVGTEEIRSNLVPDTYDYEFGQFLMAAN